jgi:hypothetical protein
MVIYIKDNEIITEFEYTKEQKEELEEKGFQPVLVPDTEVPSDYKYSDFELVSGVWKLKELL